MSRLSAAVARYVQRPLIRLFLKDDRSRDEPGTLETSFVLRISPIGMSNAFVMKYDMKEKLAHMTHAK